MIGCDGNAMGVMWLAGLLWFALITGGAGLIVWTIARGGLSQRPENVDVDDDRAHRALRERFARGEIDEAEFQQRRRVLDERAPR